MPSKDTGPGRAAVAVRPGTLEKLAHLVGVRVVRREPIRVWELSGVERLRLEGGATAILKYAAEVFANEPAVLNHAADHGVPVPWVLASTPQNDGGVAMLMEDLGEEARKANAYDAVTAALAVHTCPIMAGLPVLDAAALAELPGRALDCLRALRDAGRWKDTHDIGIALERLALVAEHRAAGADIPPFGMTHSEFHPTSIHVGPRGLRILDWAKAFTGPGLLDLVSWQGTPEPLDRAAVAGLISDYVTAGGPTTAQAQRGGVSAVDWASGWHRMWVIEWYLDVCLTWLPGHPENDALTQQVVRRHLKEATACLVK